MKKKDLDSVIQGILHMGIGTVIAQSINVLAQPLLTRLFSANTLGIYTYYLSLANLIIPVSTLKIDMLIVSEKDELEAQYLTDASIIINTIISLVYMFIICVSYLIRDNNIFNKYGFYSLMVPFLVFSNGLRFIFISYLNRYKEYKTISFVSIMRELSRGFIQIISGFLKLGSFSLLFGFCISPFVGLKFQMKNYLFKLNDRRFINWEKFKNIIAYKAKNQILFLTPSQFINSFSSILITISIAELFNSETLGYYTAGLRILELPIIFITSNISKVLFQKFSENIIDNKPIKNIFYWFVLSLSFISCLGFGTLYVIAPVLSNFFFGDSYEIAGKYIKILCLMYGTRFVTSSFSGIFTLFKKQNIELVLNVLLIIVALISHFLSFIYNFSVEKYLTFINFGYSFVYIFLLMLYIVSIQRYEKKLEKNH